jgi:outer membrane protein assembly factor BamB
VAPTGAPLVVGNSVYTAVGGRVFAIDRTSGNLQWRYPQLDPIPGRFRAAPVLADGVLVGVGDNRLAYGIDPASGAPKWTFNAPGTPIGQPVVVAGKYVVFAQSNNTLVAVNAANGEVLWTAPFAIEAGISGQIGAYGNNVLVFNTRQELISVNVNTQRADWTRRFDQLTTNPTPVVYGDTIYVNSGQFLVSLTASTGLPRRQVNTGIALAYSPAASADGVIGVSSDGSAVTFDTNLTPTTQQPINLGSGPLYAPTAAGDKFVVLTGNGGVNLVDPRAGKVIWSFIIRPIGDPQVPGTPAAPGGRPGGGFPGGGFPGGGFPGGGFPGGGGPGGGFPGGGGPGGRPGGAQANQPVTFVQASGPAVLSGTTLIVPARDGSIMAFDRELGVDLTPPRVTMLFPNPGDQVSGQPPLTLIFRLEDEVSGIEESSVKVEVDGQVLQHTLQRDSVMFVRFSAAGPNKPLADGRRHFNVTVSDWMGNKITKSFVLTIDNALPPVQLPGAQPGAVPPGRGGPGGMRGDNG